ncbi:HNH endonuclease [Thermodesulfobacteriota bacterium]
MMNDFDDFFSGVDDAVIRREKAKARELRKSNWWKNKTSKGLCHYCGAKTPAGQLTMDHIVPLARGGLSNRNNLVPTCKSCNTKKRSLLPIEWEEYMQNLDRE